jgi:hypothetical protein
MTTPADVQDEWDFYVDKVDGAAASIFLNFWFESAGVPESASRLGAVFIEMDDAGPRGLGEEAEAEAIQPFEDKLAQVIADRGGYFAGRMRSGGRWQAVFYLPADGDFDAACAEALSGLTRGWATHTQDDPEWSYYHQLLVPSPERRRWMTDRDTLDALIESGETAGAEASLTFTLWLPDAAAIDAALGGAEGFTEVGRGEVDDDGSGALRHWAQATSAAPLELKAIHRLSEALAERVEAAGGWYEGWTRAS